MDLNEELKRVRKLIVKNSLTEAVNKLKQLAVSRKTRKEIELNISRLKDLEDKVRSGQLDYREEDILRNRIRGSILDIVDQIEKISQRHPSPRRYSKIKVIFAATCTVILLISIRAIREAIYYTFLEETDLLKSYDLFDNKNEVAVNTLKAYEEETSKNSPLLKVTEISNEEVIFSISSHFGELELTELYFEAIRIHDCNTENIGQEGILVNLGEIPTYGYELILLSSVKYYRLLPNTVTNLKDSWKFDKGDISRFVVQISSEEVYSADFRVKATFVDHREGSITRLESEILRFESLDCEGRLLFQNKVIEDGKLNISPFLYKVITSNEVLSKIDTDKKEHKELYENLILEVSNIFGTTRDSILIPHEKRRNFKMCKKTSEQTEDCVKFNDMRQLERRILTNFWRIMEKFN